MTDVTTRGQRPCPHVPEDLIDWLDFIYPDRLPNSGFDIRLTDEAIGARNVIDRLKLERKRQER